MFIVGFFLVAITLMLASSFSIATLGYLWFTVLAFRRPSSMQHERVVMSSLYGFSAAFSLALAYLFVSQALWVYNFLLLHDLGALPAAMVGQK